MNSYHLSNTASISSEGEELSSIQLPRPLPRPLPPRPLPVPCPRVVSSLGLFLLPGGLPLLFGSAAEVGMGVGLEGGLPLLFCVGWTGGSTDWAANTDTGLD